MIAGQFTETFNTCRNLINLTGQRPFLLLQNIWSRLVKKTVDLYEKMSEPLDT